MINFVSRNKVGLILISLGILFIFIGIYRKEHITVLNKSNIICLECIGIG